MDINIISDVAGQFDAFKRLVAKMPNCPVLSVGDLVDRGPESKQVVEWFMTTPGAMALRGNHEDLLISYLTDYSRYEGHDGHAWLYNGGLETLKSYGFESESYRDSPERLKLIREYFPADHLKWLTNLPVYYKESALLVTHAPVDESLERWDECLADDLQFEYGVHVLWNRGKPKDRIDEGIKFQAYGHNSMHGLRFFGVPPFAACLDDSRKKVLTGLHWPSLKVYQVPYDE